GAEGWCSSRRGVVRGRGCTGASPALRRGLPRGAAGELLGPLRPFALLVLPSDDFVLFPEGVPGLLEMPHRPGLSVGQTTEPEGIDEPVGRRRGRGVFAVSDPEAGVGDTAHEGSLV